MTANERREYKAKWMREWRAAGNEKPQDPLHLHARWRLNTAVARNQVVKPKKCEVCGGGRFIEGHHEDYTKPLEVLWLCRRCDRSVHGGGGGRTAPIVEYIEAQQQKRGRR